MLNIMQRLMQVDKSGKSCKSGGGTTVMESHDNIYGPGGQAVFADVKQGGAVCMPEYSFTRLGFDDWIHLGARIPLHQHQYWLFGWTEAVWVEFVGLEHGMACCYLDRAHVSAIARRERMEVHHLASQPKNEVRHLEQLCKNGIRQECSHAPIVSAAHACTPLLTVTRSLNKLQNSRLLHDVKLQGVPVAGAS